MPLFVKDGGKQDGLPFPIDLLSDVHLCFQPVPPIHQGRELGLALRAVGGNGGGGLPSVSDNGGDGYGTRLGGQGYGNAGGAHPDGGAGAAADCGKRR